METSTKISNLSPITIDDAVEKNTVLLIAEPNVTNYQLPVIEIKEKIMKNINELKEAVDYVVDDVKKNIMKSINELQNSVDDLQPHGTENQVMLGNGNSTPAETEDGELNAPSSLFSKATFGNAFDFIYGQFANKGNALGWEEFINLIINEIISRDVIGQPPSWALIDGVNLSINAPVNAMPPNMEVSILDNNPKYKTGELVWNPSGIWNGTNSGIATFSIIPNSGYVFIFPLPMQINGSAPTSATAETDGTFTLTKSFPATMTANPAPNLSISNPDYGATRPSTATKNDSGKYSVAISWLPAGAIFPTGISTGTFTLTADNGYRWNSNNVVLNGTNYTGNLSNDGKTLTFAYQTANIVGEGTFTDTRDGKVYPWKVMPDGKKWMTVNLDYAGNGDMYINNASTPPFANAGRIYNWEHAKAAVPNGWTLPTRQNWADLITKTGDLQSGLHLRASTIWISPPGPGLDTYGFSGFPYEHTLASGYWWSATEGDNSIYYMELSAYAKISTIDKSKLFSVRCIAN